MTSNFDMISKVYSSFKKKVDKAREVIEIGRASCRERV